MIIPNSSTIASIQNNLPQGAVLSSFIVENNSHMYGHISYYFEIQYLNTIIYTVMRDQYNAGGHTINDCSNAITNQINKFNQMLAFNQIDKCFKFAFDSFFERFGEVDIPFSWCPTDVGPWDLVEENFEDYFYYSLPEALKQKPNMLQLYTECFEDFELKFLKPEIEDYLGRKL